MSTTINYLHPAVMPANLRKQRGTFECHLQNDPKTVNTPMNKNDTTITLSCGCIGINKIVDGIKLFNYTPCSTTCQTVKTILELCDRKDIPVIIRENGIILG